MSNAFKAGVLICTGISGRQKRDEVEIKINVGGLTSDRPDIPDVSIQITDGTPG